MALDHRRLRGDLAGLDRVFEPRYQPGNYNKTYGSRGAMIGFMTWMWLSAMVVLGGAKIDAVLEHADRGTAK